MTTPADTIFLRLYSLLLERKKADPASSYVALLYKEGLDRILQKVGEEAIEVVLAAKNQDQQQVIQETADLWFHTLVMLAHQNISPQQVFAELERRAIKPAQNNQPSGADRREYSRRYYNRPITLQFYNGLIIEGTTKDVSLNGLLVECSYEPKWQLLGESGFFELHSGPQAHSFSYEVTRITEEGIGLTIIRDRGMFGFILAKEVFQDVFTGAVPEEDDEGCA
ncbi:MAG: phosphoribosyl-ATP diphosphatase [Magnetococcales bacterium]|nr:phosphoribosyl-ATP diphosphatase [Magnetococcales bacterium]